MRKKIFYSFLLLFLLLTIPSSTYAQDYSVSYREQSLEQIISDLRKKTGYEFVCQKQILKESPKITCTFKKISLEQLLNRVFRNYAGLDYEIVQKTIILSKSKEELIIYKKSISGVITDENGEPLPGANIIVEGTTSGSATDLDGQFSLLVEGKDPTLRISYIGMKDKVLKINPKKENFLFIKMETDATVMDEVLVTGYQNIKRESATGSYQMLSSNEMNKRYTGTIISNLEGKVPGMMNYQNGLSNQGEAALTIRGVGSFQAKTNPLIVVDGLPIQGSIETVNPYDIESITILKDASAAAIYGARASNGVIVITTKQAQKEKLTVDFSSDFTISEKPNYDHYQWANAAEVIELEKYNFEYIRHNENPTALNSLLNNYQTNRHSVSQVSRLLIANHLGTLSDQDLNVQLNRLAQNDYRKEWQNAMKRNQLLQQYNLAFRTKGKVLSSSIVLNYKGDNNGTVNEYNKALNFSYRGDMKATDWLNLSFGANIISERAKKHMLSQYNNNRINSFQPYLSMFNEDGSRAGMEADIYLDEEALKDSELGFKPVTYNLLDEVNRNFSKDRRTNIRSFLHADFKILPEWHISTQFQYEDIYYKKDAYAEKDSYEMRYLYNLYTGNDVITEEDDITGEMVSRNIVKHFLPDGGILRNNTAEGAYYTFRTQTNYSKTFAQKHDVDLLAGFEFRETRDKSNQNLFVGYDDQTQTNNNGLANFGYWKEIEGQTSALGTNYQMYGAPDGSDFLTTNTLHRFYSLYFTGNYVYDRRYSASLSYRIDKTDLFGADPKFRGRPLWSVGLSWNIHNEAFMKPYEWLDVLKVRNSYGLTGNIDQDISSYLTATIGTNEISGDKVATLDTPPNDQLRWEKTTSINLGLDFSIWKNRLSGSLDWYRKSGSDLLTVTDLDPTTGWNQLTINNGKALNTGIEIQLNGRIIEPLTRNHVGVNASFNFAYNKNKVTHVSHKPTSGYEALNNHTLHEGYPIHSIFAYRFNGLETEDGIQYFTWLDAKGESHKTDITTDDFKVEDAVFCGGLDPKYMANFTPEITFAGFDFSAMFAFYGGHYMRARVEDWSFEGSTNGYNNLSMIEAVPRSYLNYWQNSNKNLYPANGYLGTSQVIGNYEYMNNSIVPADFLKLRNVVIGYTFSKEICRKLGINHLRIRAQMNNVATWVRNKLNLDPEANNAAEGLTLPQVPRSYTMSLFINL